MNSDSSELLSLIRDRVSVEAFDPARTLDEDQIRGLVEDACHAPSSFNMQHWRFIAVRSDADKRDLADAAFGQQQVRDAAVTFIILGDLRAAEFLPETLKPAVASGALHQGKADAWSRMAQKIYADPLTARDEAIRSCSLAAMTLMLVAEARGLCTGALTGFDPARVIDRFGIDERYLPVLLLAVGYPLHTDERRKTRLGVDEVLVFDRWS